MSVNSIGVRPPLVAEFLAAKVIEIPKLKNLSFRRLQFPKLRFVVGFKRPRARAIFMGGAGLLDELSPDLGEPTLSFWRRGFRQE